MIAMTVIFGEKHYYSSFPRNVMQKVGSLNESDIIIHSLSVPFSVYCEKDKVTLTLSNGKIINTNLGKIIIVDNDSRLACYFSECDICPDSMLLPQNCEISIGRSSNISDASKRNHVVINLSFISSIHFKLIRNEGVVTVIDQSSKNGIYLNGARVDKAVLREGDILSIYTVRIIYKNNKLFFENVGNSLQLHKEYLPSDYKEAPRKSMDSQSFLYSRSPRLVEKIQSNVINLEKPPQNTSTPQINWLSVLLTPAITIVLMVVLSVAMNMSPVMLIMSGVMSLISAIIAIVNYRKQKASHKFEDDRIKTKYCKYLQSVSKEIETSKSRQMHALESSNPSPRVCLDIVTRRSRQLWERNNNDEDFLAIRVGLGTVSAAKTATYRQDQVVLTESELEIEAKKLAQSSLLIENAPILCEIGANKRVGIIGNRSEEIQLVRNMIIELATVHSYDEVKIVMLIPEKELSEWSWVRWLPHCSDNDRTERYLFTSLDDAEDTLDNIAAILSKRAVERKNSYSDVSEEINPHYVFVVASYGVVEKHPIKKYLLDDLDIGCSSLFVYDKMSALPKECNDIVEITRGNGEFFSKQSSTQKTKFKPDSFSLKEADNFSRLLAPIYVATDNGAATLPSSVSFLRGYGVNTPEELDIEKRWKTSKTYNSLAVPIGIMSGGEVFQFDIHEKAHGVNGVVAGMPGSGKTEMVQTWLLSLAVNYSPKDISFVLIDFKGTGMIAPFKGLPHVAGTISNLDTNIDRNLIAIRSEVHRRETLIDKYSSFNIKNINDLNKACDRGVVNERLPILIIVIDEYAEFKLLYPDFGAEIDSLTSKGRALGMFVILMTQKPAGVVSAKSEDNIKFRWCLRVANYNASREMLGRGDAARITNPGRAFVKVGEDDVYEQVQSFWSGAPYNPVSCQNKGSNYMISKVQLNGKRKACEQINKQKASESNDIEISAVVNAIIDFCRENNISEAKQVWTKNLLERIDLFSAINTTAFNGEYWPDTYGCSATIGVVDDPGNQSQYPLVLDFTKVGHTIVYGAPVTGKTTLLQTLLMSVAMTYRPDQVNMYVMDFGGWNMGVLRDLPHVGGIANDNDPDRLSKLSAMLLDALEDRKAKFSSAGVSNILSYHRSTDDSIPFIILAVDNFGPVLKMYPELEQLFVTIVSVGANYGVYLVATASAINAVPMKISQSVKNSIALQMIEKTDYTYTVGKTNSQLPNIVGRGYVKGYPPLEFQTALPGNGADDKAVHDSICEIANTMNLKWTGDHADMIPEMPAVIPYNSVKSNDICIGLSTEKVQPIGLDPGKQHYLLISGIAQSGKSNMLCVISKQLKHKTGGNLYVFDTKGDGALLFKHDADVYLNNVKEIDNFIESIRPELQKRQAQKQSDSRAVFSPIIIAIDNYSVFFKEISNDSIARLYAIVKLGAGLGLYLFATCDAYELTSLINRGETVSLAMIKGQYSVMFGGCMNDHASIPCKESLSQKNAMLKEGEGYLVNNGKCICFKAMSSVEEVTK